MKYINVAIDNKSEHTDTLYTYGCEDDQVQVGQKVYVPFGLGDKVREAYVFQVLEEPEQEYKKLKFAEKIDEEVSLTEEIIDTCMWMKRRYLCKYIDAVKCFTPAGSRSKRGKERNPYKDAEGEAQNILSLTAEQERVLAPIRQAISEGRHRRFLLHGVTGSGKTEVYMRAVAKCLEEGRQAVMLVPEISLTKQIIERFIGRFGSDSIAVLHSRLSLGERYDEWSRIRSGQVKIVIGARSAVFAPLSQIGLVVLDEEHETTYKSDMTPKYDAVEVALKRLQHHDGVLLLGSATPGVATYFRSCQGIYERLELTSRYNQVALPQVSVVDMRDEMKAGNRSIISRQLYEAMETALEKKQQIILFLNRRGYSTFISCRECGKVLKCPDCGISLTYHKDKNRAVCHYCGYEEKPPEICPDCGSRYIRYFGTGTEKVEETVRGFFEKASVERLDLDTTKRKGSIERILNSFKKGKIDILIGTQLVAKGLDFKNVGLVGIISADVTLNIPDFRSPERTFQMITQAAGRAGRGDETGTVIIQSYTPENYAVQLAAEQDYKGFYETEIQLRQYMGYPPYSDLIQLVFASKTEEKAKGAAENWYEKILSALGGEEKECVFRPQAAPMSKIKEQYRYCMLIKCPQGKRRAYSEILETLKEAEKIKKKDYTVNVDINPYSFI
ncbi:primosomal protein N' [Anaerovorax odorimutans]|uniref:Replication restart protein PriA n=1 Tax=Anaerovorax odorimutans TaxID=109327 RepID=A0ABT1RJE5_9FIRM|nr:primosomal protein N' [Anaerovorax odorimutans]MCQ4635303.1 primosomal protein N' [Anaerovorax odorimutans]